ncbi:hypothetical protein MFMK1_002326 [Metallumcola ferriviriculae]|uniref:Maturase K n=1 Tax=Metallumcola ferriviriculae TaxID=3039180 RepID=A0AAU0UNJ0_9FIRM|nr:hypothetical protein MFMK1_002326 [Desulfitibacteraceae bacterium MK1]
MEQLETLFDRIFLTQQPSADRFSVYRFYQLLDQEPINTLEVLFFNYHWRQEKINYSVMKGFFLRHSPHIYHALTKFAVPLERNYLYACLEKDFFSKQVSFLATLRNLIKDTLKCITDNTTVNSKDAARTLRNMKHTDNIALQVKENLRIPFDSITVLDDVETFANGAEVLADLSQMRCAYFSPAAVVSFPPTDENIGATPFLSRHLQQLLTPKKKEQICQVLKSIIENHPLPDLVKQALALYMTLMGDDIPWQKHPFILRLYYNSYWHWKVQQIRDKATEGVKT